MATTKYFYVVLVAISLIPVALKRELGEFPILSYMLTTAVFLFIIVTACLLGSDPSQAYPLSEYNNLSATKFNIISSIAILCTAFSYQTSVFPAYTSMHKKSTERFL